MRKIALLALGFGVCVALEFGSMGNVSASVGGAGVAYRKNNWALYYNPALLAANRQYNIAYSFGVGYAENNLAQLANINYDNIQNLPDTITNIVGTNKSATSGAIGAAGGNAVANATGNYGDFGDISKVLANITWNVSSGGGITNDDTLKSYLESVTGNGTSGSCGNGSNIDHCINSLTGNTTALTKIKEDLLGAIDKTEASGGGFGLGLLNSIVQNLDVTKIDRLIKNLKDSAQDGKSFDMQLFLSAVGGISINRGANTRIDTLLDDYAIINQSISDNSLKINSDNGLVFHFGGNKYRGAIGIGILAQVRGFMQLNMDESHKRIIIKNGTSYYEVEVGSDKLTLTSVGNDGETTYKNSSILSPEAQHNLYSNNLALVEIPLGYGHTIPFIGGDFHIGANLKYIYATSIYSSQYFNLDNIKLDFNLKDNMRQTHTFGIDLGTLYTVSGFSVGLVAKNLNAPKIKTIGDKIKLNTQVRAGAGLELWRFTFLFDVDVLPNMTLEPGKKSQMFGGGVIFDATWVDFRLGAMKDILPNPYGTIITGGINIAHFLDISVQSSLRTKRIKDYDLPNYLDIRIGGRFTF